MASRVYRIVERVLLAGGLALFAFLLYGLGVGITFAHLQAVGWGVVLIVAQEILAFGANTAGWRLAFPPPGLRVPFRTLLGARIAGDAVNYLTPTATIGGEFVRGRMLRGFGSTTVVIASLAVAKLTQTIGLLAFVLLGLLLVMDGHLLPDRVRAGLLIGLGALAVGLTLLVAAQRRGMFGPLARLLEGRARGWLSAEVAPSLRRLDEEIARAHRGNTMRLALSCAAFCLGFAGGVVESYLTLWFLGVPVTLKLALAVEVLGVALSNLLFFVPLRAGTQEAGKVLIFTILGLDPAKGLAMGILYRVRELTWALIGLGLLYRSQHGSTPGVAGASTPVFQAGDPGRKRSGS